MDKYLRRAGSLLAMFMMVVVHDSVLGGLKGEHLP